MKLAVTVQVLATASVVPQVVVSLKALALVPVNDNALMMTGTVPVLVRVTDCEALVLPTAVRGKTSEVGLAVMVGTAADPARATVTGVVAVLLMIDSVATSEAVVVSA